MTISSITTATPSSALKFRRNKRLTEYFYTLDVTDIKSCILRNWPFMGDHSYLVEAMPIEMVPNGQTKLSFLMDTLGWKVIEEDIEVDEYNLNLKHQSVDFVLKNVELFSQLTPDELNNMGLIDWKFAWLGWNFVPQQEQYLLETHYGILLQLGYKPELQKIFWRHWNNWRKQDDSVTQFNKLLFLVSQFGKEFDRYSQMLLSNPAVKESVNPEQSYHDMFCQLAGWYDEEEYREELNTYLLSKASGPHWARAQSMANSWSNIRQQGWEPKMGMDKFFWLLGDGPKIETLIKEIRNQNVHSVPSSIPQILFTQEAWTVRTLNLSDDKELFLGVTIGDHTGCCQKFGGAAHSSAVYSVSHSDSNVLIASKNGEIYAQSWMWRCGNVVVLDNLEIKSTTPETKKRITELWLEVAQQMVGQLGINKVFLGLGNGDHAKIPELLKKHGMNSQVLPVGIDPPSGTYSDAKKAICIAK